MKIDCPHCGVHGSVDNTLLDKKLRCPKCSKVFLVTEDILPEFDNRGMLSQEILYDDEPHSPDLPEEDDDLFATMAEGGDASTADDDFLGLMDDESEDSDPDDEYEDGGLELDEDEIELEKCSSCGELLHPAFLEPVGSENLCALCLPEGYLDTETEEDSLSITDPEDVQEIEEIEKIEEIEEIEEIDIELEEDLTEPENDSSIQTLMDDDIADELDEEIGDEIDDDVELVEEESEDQEEDYPTEPCSVCGEEFHRDFMQEIDSKLFCGVCQPEVVEEESENDTLVLAGAGAAAVAGAVMATGDEKDENDEPDEPDELDERNEPDELDELDELDEVDEGIDAKDESDDEIDEEESETGSDFTVGELLKEAWQKTKGVKASVWGAVIAMLVVISGVFFGGMAAFQAYYKGMDPNVILGANCGAQLVANWLSMLMTGGIMLIGVRHVLEQRVTWKMVFAGFSRAFSITMALILQTILITIGFLLLVLPGIYLSVGYSLALPLILDKGMGPWEALEASRKAIHKKWWTVFGLWLVMVLISIVSMIPFGIGLIWIIPMFFVLTGVLYVRLFGSDVFEEENPEGQVEDEAEEELEEEIEEEVEEKLEEISEEVESKK